MWEVDHLERHKSVQRALDRIQAFFVAARLSSHKDLDALFAKHHLLVLKELRIATGSGDGGDPCEADVFVVTSDGYLKPFLEPTCLANREWLPSMRLTLDPANSGTFLRPDPKSGVATYCMWESSRGRLGGAIADDVHNTGDLSFVLIDPPSIERVEDMYMPVPGVPESPRYRSMLCVSIPVTYNIRASEARDSKWVGILSLTSPRPAAFDENDVGWAIAAASGIGHLYQLNEFFRHEIRGI